MIVKAKMFGVIVVGFIVLAVAQVKAMPADALKGRVIFAISCSGMSCHAMEASSLVGWPIPKMLAKFEEYKNMDAYSGPDEKMQDIMLDLDEQALLNIATYLKDAE